MWRHVALAVVALVAAAGAPPLPLALAQAVGRHGPVREWDAQQTAEFMTAVGFPADVARAVVAKDVQGSVLLQLSDGDVATELLTAPSGVDLARWRALRAHLEDFAGAQRAAPPTAPSPSSLGALLAADPAGFLLAFFESCLEPRWWVVRARLMRSAGPHHPLLLFAPGRPTTTWTAFVLTPWLLPVMHYHSFLASSPWLASLGLAASALYALSRAAGLMFVLRGSFSPQVPELAAAHLLLGASRQRAMRWLLRQLFMSCAWALLAALQAFVPLGLGLWASRLVAATGVAIVSLPPVSVLLWNLCYGKSLQQALLNHFDRGNQAALFPAFMGGVIRSGDSVASDEPSSGASTHGESGSDEPPQEHAEDSAEPVGVVE